MGLYNKTMKYLKLLLILTIATSHIADGCQIDGINSWLVPVGVQVTDVFTGVFFQRSTTNIAGINSISWGEGLIKGPYIQLSHSNNQFTIATNNDFPNYEENETTPAMAATVVFNCVGGNTATLVLMIDVIDTNNNDPQFKRRDNFEFTIAPPLPPNFAITGCESGIVVRDIDLTTQRIDFKIEDNPYFQITYEASSTPKEFIARLSTTTYIRTFSEPLTLRISATDVDLTGDPPRTTYGTIRIQGDNSFELPDDILFTETFYLGDYTQNNQVLLQPISLKQGYNDHVKFSLEGEYSRNFNLIDNDNSLSLEVTQPLPTTVLRLERQIYLIVKAENELITTSTATIVLNLPEDIALQFEKTSYEGRIENNTLLVPQLILSHSYQDENIIVNIENEYSSFFTASILGNVITLSMNNINQDVIDKNNYIQFQVTASTDRSSAVTVVILEIIKDDNVTPVFGKSVYSGSYDAVSGLTLEQLEIIQGYDETVSVRLVGEQSKYFSVSQNGQIITLLATQIPADIFSEGNLLFTVEANKPRTVGATATVTISLPEEIVLKFEKSSYEGTIENNTLLIPQLILSQGYEDKTITVDIQNEFTSFFTASIQENIITLSINDINQDLIDENNYIQFQVTASTDRSSAVTVVILEIIKDDNVTPVFGKSVYSGSYDAVSGLTLEQLEIIQGYDETVSVRLVGEQSKYFSISQNGQIITLLATQIPVDIFSEGNLLFTVEANKPRTVGATATVTISLPEEIVLKFEKSSYEGTIENNTLLIPQLILSQGYQDKTITVDIQNEFSSFFTASIQENVITLSINDINQDLIDENNYIQFQVTASTDRSSAVTVVILEIIKDDNVTPVFGKSVYSGSYDAVSGLTLEQLEIIQGYDETVSVRLVGEQSKYFSISQNGQIITLLATQIPADIFSEGNLLFTVEATKPRTVGATATVKISLPEEIVLKFEKSSYEGTIENNTLLIPQLILSQGYQDKTITVDIQNEFTSFFTASIQENIITLSINDINQDLIDENNYIQFQVTASTGRSSAVTVVILEIIKDDNVTPVFGKSVYSGSYDAVSGLTLEQLEIIQGYDATVSVRLEGEQSKYFSISQNGQIITLLVTQIPADVFSEGNLLFTVVATKPRTVGTTVAVSISLPKARVLSFAATNYKGSIQNDSLILDTILLNNGYDIDVNFTLTGDYSNYFDYTNTQNEIIIYLSDQIPDNVLQDNSFLVLTLGASGLHSVPTSTSIVLEIIKDDISTPWFTKNIYYGNFTEDNKIEIENIGLEQGFDESVGFRLEGESAIYFDILQKENNIEIYLKNNIPEEVIFSEKVFVFSILAEKSLTVGGRATVYITFPEDLINLGVMTFANTTHVGRYENNSLSLDNIILNSGYKLGTQFKLSGEYASYFTLNDVNNIATISIANALPIQILENNKFMVLEVEASRDRAVSVSTSVIIDIIKGDVVHPVFSEPHYIGVYIDGQGLEIDEIFLAQGYDETVSFDLEGENAQLFRLSDNGNSIRLVTDKIPEEVLVNNSYLIFAIVAFKTDAMSVRSTIIIDLPKENSELKIFGFEQKSYIGKIENNELQLVDLHLLQEYNQVLQFNLTGELAKYFGIIDNQNSITIQLLEPLPAEINNDIDFTILDVTVYHPESISGHATVVIQIIKAPDPLAPVFAEPFYVGEYSAKDGLVFTNYIQLSHGFDETVVFTLEGDDSQWFSLIENGRNNLTLSLSNNTLEIKENTFLTFSVEARKPNGMNGKTAIVISLSAPTMKFSEQHYVGSMKGSNISLSTIILEEGYSSDVQAELIGDFNEYFTVSHENGIFTLRLRTELPSEVLMEMNLLVFSLEAKVGSSKAEAIIVIELVDDRIMLTFDEIYYTGTYSETDGLRFEQQIILQGGFDDTVLFNLDGGDAQWFTLRQSENALILIQNSPIPPGVLENNQILIFTVNAKKPYHDSALATIIISLEKENTIHVLSFERINYVGTIENDVTTLEPIRLSDSNMENINITLFGELKNYFKVTFEANVVKIELAEPLPDSVKSKNGIVVLEMRASADEALPAYSTVIFEIIKPQIVLLEFNEMYYTGVYLESEGFIFDSLITLVTGYDDTVKFELKGDSSRWFDLKVSGNSVSLVLLSPIPSGELVSNHQLVFFLTASNAGNQTTSASIVISIMEDYVETQVLSFEHITYSGTINNSNINLDPITLSKGYSSNLIISFILFGEYSDKFGVNTNGPFVTIVQHTLISDSELDDTNLIILELQASASEFIPAQTAIVLEVVKDKVLEVLTFSEPYYIGQYSQEEGVSMQNLISLIEGYDDTVLFDLEGDTAIWFGLQRVDENAYTITLKSAIPPAIVANNQRFIFTVAAQKIDSHLVRATIVISLMQEYYETDTLMGFEKVSYTGTIDNNTSITLEPIVLTEGFSENVIFQLHGANVDYFAVSWIGSTATVLLKTPIPDDFILENSMVILEIEAIALNSIPAHATIIFEIVKDVKDLLTFEETYYYGEYNDIGGLIFENKITLSNGYDEKVTFNLEGDSATWFKIVQNENSGSLFLDSPIPADVIQSNTQLIFIVIAEKPNGNTARATIIITLNRSNTEKAVLAFEEISYLGTLADGVPRLGPIILSEGSALNVKFILHGELSTYFAVSLNEGFVTITLINPIPEEAIPSNQIIILELHALALDASPAFATIVLEVICEKEEVYFDKILYNGLIQGSLVQHEVITLNGYTGTVFVVGAYENLFTATLVNKVVTITTTGSLVLPQNVTSIALELTASRAATVLILNIENAETPVLPKITFSSKTYDLQVNFGKTGLIGRVFASTDNGEAITYTLKIENEYLLQRISINVNGEIYLSAPTTNGTYFFNVEATTIITRATETASIILTINDESICTDDDIYVAPLIVIDRDEEVPHLNLVTSDYPGCQYVMTNRWPANQTWLYVDNDGLHTTAIDREHSSIAFMPVSQVQVELVLQCESDNLRHKRSTNYQSITDRLGPYDYGSNKWLLTDEIAFNPRKTLVNLIVNDINDNKPIFNRHENATLVVGYPIPALEDSVLPRSLAELQATDADIGENAVLRYWTSESVIAVSPTTGFVHVRKGVKLEDNMNLIVHATDRFGDGNTGSIELLVKLVDSRHIVVVTVRDLFLDEEKTILETLSASVGYEVKALRSVIVTEDVQSSDGQINSRIKRETSNDVGTSMRVFVYGLVDKEPVPVEQLKNDISSIASDAVSIVNTVSLEDHLEGREICDISGRDTGLLVATIVLSVLLFILILAIGLWFFLKWWRKRKYDEFSDEKSLESARKSIEEFPEPELITKPRLNIDDLRRSEKRLQEMLDAPIQEIEVTPATPQSSVKEIEVPPIQPHVIQSIDKLKKADGDSDEDEFGEQKSPRKKSVVTFNENVEKIIHVEDNLNDDSDYEVYKL